MDVEYVGPIMDERFWLTTLAATEKVNPYVLLVRVRLLSSPACSQGNIMGVTMTDILPNNDNTTNKNFNGESSSNYREQNFQVHTQNQNQNQEIQNKQNQIQNHNPEQNQEIQIQNQNQNQQNQNYQHLGRRLKQFHYLLIRDPTLVQCDAGRFKNELSSLTHIPHDRMKLSFPNIPSSHLLFDSYFQLPLLRALFGAVINCEEIECPQSKGVDVEEIRQLQNALRTYPVPMECQPSLRGVLNVLMIIPFRTFSLLPKDNVGTFRTRYQRLNLDLGLPHHKAHVPSTSIQLLHLPRDILCVIIGNLISGKSFGVCIRRFGLVCQKFFGMVCSQHEIISPLGFSGEAVRMMMQRLANEPHICASELNLAYAPIRIEAILDSVVQMKALERLYLSGHVFSDATKTLNELTTKLPNLNVLWLNKTNVTAASVAIALKNCPSLRIDCSHSCVKRFEIAQFGGKAQAINYVAPTEAGFEFLAELPPSFRDLHFICPELKILPVHLVENAMYRKAEVPVMRMLCDYYWKGNLSPECIAYAFSNGNWPPVFWDYVFSRCRRLPKELLLWCLNEVLLLDQSGISRPTSRVCNDAFSALIRSPACHEEFPWEIITDSHHRYCFVKRVINEGFPLTRIPHDLLLQIIDHSSILLNAVQEEQLCTAFLQHYKEIDCKVLDEQLSEELIRKSLRFPCLVTNLLKSGIKLTISPTDHIILYMAEFAHTSTILAALIDYNSVDARQIPAEVGAKALMQHNYDFFTTLCDKGWPASKIHQIYPAELYTEMAIVSLLDQHRYPFWLLLRRPCCQNHRVHILRSAPLDVREFFLRLRLFSDDDQKAALIPLVPIPDYPNMARATFDSLSESKQYSAANPEIEKLIKHGKCINDRQFPFARVNIQGHSVTELDDDMPMRPLKRQRTDLGQAFKTTQHA